MGTICNSASVASVHFGLRTRGLGRLCCCLTTTTMAARSVVVALLAAPLTASITWTNEKVSGCVRARLDDEAEFPGTTWLNTAGNNTYLCTAAQIDVYYDPANLAWWDLSPTTTPPHSLLRPPFYHHPPSPARFAPGHDLHSVPAHPNPSHPNPSQPASPHLHLFTPPSIQLAERRAGEFRGCGPIAVPAPRSPPTSPLHCTRYHHRPILTIPQSTVSGRRHCFVRVPSRPIHRLLHRRRLG